MPVLPDLEYPLQIIGILLITPPVAPSKYVSKIPRYIGTAASIEALTSIRGLNVEEDVLLEDADDSELVALADDTTPGTPASEASGGARYCSI